MSPVANAPLDNLIAHLKATDVVAITDIDPKDLAAGLEDLKNRMAHAEHSHLKVLANSRTKDDRIANLEGTVGSLEHDRNEMQKTVKTSTDLPIATDKKLTELEARVRAVEGAVGAAPFKPAKPIEPATGREPKTDTHPAYDAPPPKNKPEPFPDVHTPNVPHNDSTDPNVFHEKRPLPESLNPVSPS